MNTAPRSVLIVGPSWVGDMVMAQSLFKLLKERNPATVIDVLAPSWTLPLLARMPEVRAGIALPVTHGELRLARRYRLGRRLRDQRYQQAIVLPNSFKSALIPWWAAIPLRTGYRGEWRWGVLNDRRHLDKAVLPMTVQRFLKLGVNRDEGLPASIPSPALRVRPEDSATALARLGLTGGAQPVLALCPGAEYGSSKRWPAHYFAEVARAKLAQGWAVWLFGSEKDAPITAAVRALAGAACVDLAGRTRLDEAIDLLALADLVVSNDSGLMHVAAALGRKLIALYGSSDARATPPLSDTAQIVSLNLSCSPCLKRECPLGHTHCLHELKPVQVLERM